MRSPHIASAERNTKLLRGERHVNLPSGRATSPGAEFGEPQALWSFRGR